MSSPSPLPLHHPVALAAIFGGAANRFLLPDGPSLLPAARFPTSPSTDAPSPSLLVLRASKSSHELTSSSASSTNTTSHPVWRILAFAAQRAPADPRPGSVPISSRALTIYFLIAGPKLFNRDKIFFPPLANTSSCTCCLPHPYRAFSVFNRLYQLITEPRQSLELYHRQLQGTQSSMIHRADADVREACHFSSHEPWYLPANLFIDDSSY